MPRKKHVAVRRVSVSWVCFAAYEGSQPTSYDKECGKGVGSSHFYFGGTRCARLSNGVQGVIGRGEPDARFGSCGCEDCAV